MPTVPVKILGVIDEDPFDYRTWSGSSNYFFTALKRNNFLYDAISAQPSKLSSAFYKGLSFHPDISKWIFKYRINTLYYDHMKKVALTKIKKMNDKAYNVILQVGAWYNLTKIKDKLTVSYHDGNLHALLKSPYGHPGIKGKYIKRALDYEKSLYADIDYIFPMSKWLADSFIRDFEVKPGKIMPAGAGINLPYVKEVKNKNYSEPKILFIGKNFERKGGKQLLEAFTIVKKEIRHVTLTIIGTDLNSAPEGVRCLGHVSKYTAEGMSLLLDEYAKASIFVMPSLYEPFGIVFAEAMAHKLPCIGTNICAMPEIIDNGTNGYTVPPGDSMSLAKRIISLLKEPQMCREMGENAHAKYLDHYTWDIVANKITERINSIL